MGDECYIADDIEVAARAIRGSSWPLDMAQRMEERADRLMAYADSLRSTPPSAEEGGR